MGRDEDAGRAGAVGREEDAGRAGAVGREEDAGRAATVGGRDGVKVPVGRHRVLGTCGIFLGDENFDVLFRNGEDSAAGSRVDPPCGC